MRWTRLAAILLLSALPVVLEAQAGTMQLDNANQVLQEGDGQATVTNPDIEGALTIPALDDSGKLLLFCLFGTAGTLLLRRQKGRR